MYSSDGIQIHCEIKEPTPAPLLWMATARNIVVTLGTFDVTQPLRKKSALYRTKLRALLIAGFKSDLSGLALGKAPEAQRKSMA